MRLHLKWILISLLAISTANAQSNVPKTSTAVRPSTQLRVFKNISDWSYVASFIWQPDDEGNFEKLKLSVRRRLPYNMLVGVFLRHTWGERHPQDWIKDATDNEWKWRNVEDKKEFNTGALLQKKWSLSNDLVFETRVIYDYHLGNDMSILRVRPGLSWQFAEAWIAYLKYEAYMGLNFSSATFYKQGTYLGFLYSGYQGWLVGPFARFERHEWETSPQFKQLVGSKFRTHENLLSLGMSANFYF